MFLPVMVALGIVGSPSAAREGVAHSGDGVDIRYRVLGEGSPALVFVHCWACDQHLWDAQLPDLARQHRVVTLDLAGHGGSGRTRKDYTIEAFGSDVQAVVEALDLKDVILIGHSMGGPIILDAARRLGGRVKGLVPVDTLLDVDRHDDPKETEAFLAALRTDFKVAATKFVRDWMFVPGSDPRLIDQIVAKVASFPPEVGISALRNVWAFDSAAALEATKVPVYAVNADKFPTNLTAARRHAVRFNATIMKGVGHYLMLEDPKRFGEHLAEALRGLRTASSAGG